MPSLYIRNLPDDVYQALALRAKREHRSLAQQAVIELRQILRLAADEHRRQVVERIRRELQGPADAPTPTPEELVRADRDR
jgi:plasmid stability protein